MHHVALIDGNIMLSTQNSFEKVYNLRHMLTVHMYAYMLVALAITTIKHEFYLPVLSLTLSLSSYGAYRIVS